jgi:hypothetical protein
MRSLGSPYVDKGKLRHFLKTNCKKSWEIAQPEQKLAKNICRVGNKTL